MSHFHYCRKVLKTWISISVCRIGRLSYGDLRSNATPNADSHMLPLLFVAE